MDLPAEISPELGGGEASGRADESGGASGGEGAHEGGGGGALRQLPRDVSLELLHGRVLPALHAALDDYTTDNRGDAGSMVREAAMSVLVRALVLAARLGGRDDARLPGAVSAAAGALLKQAVERIMRVRDAASRHLADLVADPDLAAHVPARAALSASLPLPGGVGAGGCEDDDTGGGLDAGVASGDSAYVDAASGSLERLPLLVALLPVPQYTAPLLEGLVASVGGVDASLSRAASKALVDVVVSAGTVPQADQPPGGGGNGSGGGGGRTELEPTVAVHGWPLLPRLACALLEVWGRHARSPRMAGPLLRTAELLATRTSLMDACVVPPQHAALDGGGSGDGGDGAGGAPPGPQPLPQLLVPLARTETRGCSDVQRLVSAASLLCVLLKYSNPCHASAAQGLLVLLISRLPKVRGAQRSAGRLVLLISRLPKGCRRAAGAAHHLPAIGLCMWKGRGGCAAQRRAAGAAHQPPAKRRGGAALRRARCHHVWHAEKHGQGARTKRDVVLRGGGRRRAGHCLCVVLRGGWQEEGRALLVCRAEGGGRRRAGHCLCVAAACGYSTQ
eukprot:351761-Chlamydomonas_euryale.AAC.1